MDVMRTRVWLAEMMRVTGSANLNQMGVLIDDVDDKKMLYRYANGENGVSKKKLLEIDARIKQRKPSHVDGSSFFLIGPESARDSCDFVPLWDALGGSIEKVSEVLSTLDPAVAVQKCQGVSFRQRCGYLVYPLFNEYDPPAYWENPSQENCIAERYRNGELTVDIDLITFAIAAWRMAHFMGDSIALMDYVLIGLLDRAIPETFDQHYKIQLEKLPKAIQCVTYTIAKDLLAWLKMLSEKDIEEAKNAIVDLNYSAPIYPFDDDGEVVSIGHAQPLDHTFLIHNIQRSSVFEFLVQRNKRLESAGAADEVSGT